LPGPVLQALDPGGGRGRWHVGDLPVFNLAHWVNARSFPAGIRLQARRARNRGLAVRHLPDPPAEMAPLCACLRAWLREKPLPPLGFVTSPWLFDPWPEEGVFVAEREVDGKPRVEGFLVASRVLFGDMFRVDAVGRDPDAPNGCSELLIAEAFRHAAGRGIVQATTGLAPLARRSGVPRGGLSERMLARLGNTGLGYSFAGLEAFKAKFAPDAWVPLYCVAPGRRFKSRDVLAVIRAFAGGSLLRYAARVLLWKLGCRAV
jgi:phosphatidylglycerol lysyltransferase